jgi:hypothetical protein
MKNRLIQRRRHLALAAGLAVVLVACAWDSILAQDPPAYTNLKVLPEDISRDELLDVMLGNLRGLGLPRRSGEGCLYCHVGSTETPRSTWDYASDDNPMKAKARVMMEMVAEINEVSLARLDARIAPSLEVGCYTCHAGRTDPSPLPDLLMRKYNAGGMAALEATYRTARARYYERDTYDFRVGTLVGVADQLAGMGKVADAASVHELNIEFQDSPQAWGALIRLRLFEALQTSGPEAMIARYHELKGEHPAKAFNPRTTDSLAWHLQRSGQEEIAMLLFELNYAEHPTAFASTESLAYAVFAAGDQERGLKLARDWIEAHPDHKGGHQLLAELTR